MHKNTWFSLHFDVPQTQSDTDLGNGLSLSLCIKSYTPLDSPFIKEFNEP